MYTVALALIPILVDAYLLYNDENGLHSSSSNLVIIILFERKKKMNDFTNYAE